MKMAFRFDVRRLASGLLRTIRRFPLSVAFCAASAAVLIVLAHADDPASYLNAARAISLGLPLGFCAALFAESRSLSRARVLALIAAILLALAAYYGWMTYSSGSSLVRPFSVEIRHVMFYAIALLSIPLVPFALRPEARSAGRSWAFVYSLARSFVLAVFWGGALFVGISAAFLSVSFLFEINVSEHWYSDTWILLATIFSPVFFLSRVPSVASVGVVDAKSYPKELRLFAQFVLLPLTVGYFVILYSYAARIAWLRVWPEGQLAYLIMGASAVGILAYAALYPLRDGVKWIRRVGDALVALMIPLSGLLFWAVDIRISEYGVTENRYLVCAFGAWVLASSVYLLASRTKDVRAFPAILCAIALVISVGPWSAFSVSERSQTNRLASILASHGLLVDGRLQESGSGFSTEERREVEDIFEYLERFHGGNSLVGWFGGPMASIDMLSRVFESSQASVDSDVQEEKEAFLIRVDDSFGDVVDTSGLNRYVRINLYASRDLNPGGGMEIDGVSYRWTIGDDGESIVLWKQDESLATLPVATFLNSSLNRSSDTYSHQISYVDSVVMYSTERLDAVIAYERVQGAIVDGGFAVDRILADVFFALK